MYQGQPHFSPTVRDTNSIPAGLKALVIALTVLKALPLMVVLFVLAVIALVADEFAEEFDEFGDLAGTTLIAVVVVGLIVVAIGALMLFFHVSTAMRSRAGGLMVIACIMGVLDLLLVISVLFGDPVDPGAVMMLGLPAAAQVTVFVWALKIRSDGAT